MKLLVLGTAQDAGIPQLGCICNNCTRAISFPSKKRFAASIALFDKEARWCYMFDATPDIREQVRMIQKQLQNTKRAGKLPLDGIFLTHAHFGHCAGLWFLGKESIAEEQLPIYCSKQMVAFLENNHPFDHLISDENINPIAISPHKPFISEGKLKVTPFEVPHRNELANTVGYVIKSGRKSVLYLPDIDCWTDEVRQLVTEVDIAFLDGTFYSKSELPRFATVPHPTIEESLDFFADCKTDIYFTHFNHTNKLLEDTSTSYKTLKNNGMKRAEDGLFLNL